MITEPSPASLRAKLHAATVRVVDYEGIPRLTGLAARKAPRGYCARGRRRRHPAPHRPRCAQSSTRLLCAWSTTKASRASPASLRAKLHAATVRVVDDEGIPRAPRGSGAEVTRRADHPVR